MRKTIAPVSTPGLQPSSTTKIPRHLPLENKKAAQREEPVQPNEEIVDRLNDIGKTYPFCVYYRSQSNDPL